MYRPRRHADPAKLPPTWATSFTGTTGAGRSCAQIAPFGRFPGGHADDRAAAPIGGYRGVARRWRCHGR